VTVLRRCAGSPAKEIGESARTEQEYDCSDGVRPASRWLAALGYIESTASNWNMQQKGTKAQEQEVARLCGWK
jgi:hypothetical protein